jgi:hypothetical protein
MPAARPAPCAWSATGAPTPSICAASPFSAMWWWMATTATMRCSATMRTTRCAAVVAMTPWTAAMAATLTSCPATRPAAGAASSASTPTPTPAPCRHRPHRGHGRRRGHRPAQFQCGLQQASRRLMPSGATGTVRLVGDWSADTIDLRGVTVLGNVVVDGYHGNDSCSATTRTTRCAAAVATTAWTAATAATLTSCQATRPAAGAALPASTPTPTPAPWAPTASWPRAPMWTSACAASARPPRHRGHRCLGRDRHRAPGRRLERRHHRPARRHRARQCGRRWLPRQRCAVRQRCGQHAARWWRR